MRPFCLIVGALLVTPADAEPMRLRASQVTPLQRPSKDLHPIPHLPSIPSQGSLKACQNDFDFHLFFESGSKPEGELLRRSTSRLPLITADSLIENVPFAESMQARSPKGITHMGSVCPKSMFVTIATDDSPYSPRIVLRRASSYSTNRAGSNSPPGRPNLLLSVARNCRKRSVLCREIDQS